MNQQVKFRDSENAIHGGIMVDNKTIICACCGGNLEVEDVTILEIYDDWIDFTEFILE